MGTISENLQIIKESLEAIREEIINNGGIVRDITSYASAIHSLCSPASNTDFLICVANRPDPRTGADRLTAVVFQDIYQGDTWGDLVGLVDITGKFVLKQVTMPNGTVTVVISGDCDYFPDGPLSLEGEIDTSDWYLFIYG